MNGEPAPVNLMIGWLWIGLGFASGALLGLRFAGENWLGGYASFRRRLYRLGHISFFGLGFVNLLFHLTVRSVVATPVPAWTIASWSFVLGAILMPLCCVIMAHRPNARPHLLFALPVGALLAGGICTLWLLLES